MTLRAVLFDLWGTLILDSEDRWRPRQAWRSENVRRVLAANGLTIEPEAIGVALEAAGQALSRLHDAGRDVSSAGRAALFLELLGPGGEAYLPATAEGALEAAICGLDAGLGPRSAPDALAVLEAVRRRGLRTALVSNAGLTSARYLREMLAWHGLDRLLDCLVFSDEAETAKPDRQIFDRALEGIGAKAAECVFVGDSPHHDVFGAHIAGMLAVQIGHRNGPPPTGYALNAGAEPEARIGTLSELLETIRRLEGEPAPL